MRGKSDDDEISRIKVLCIHRCRIVVENGKDDFRPVSIGVVRVGHGQLVAIRAAAHDARQRFR